MKQLISITSIASISALGSTPKEIWENYLNPVHFLQDRKFSGKTALVGELASGRKNEIDKLRTSQIKYKELDASVLYGLFAARLAFKRAGWKASSDFGINIGSSRGATQLFEQYHREFLESDKTPTLASPTTTLGNISSWVGHDLQAQGPTISHSITCSTALHALLNGVAWLGSGMVDSFMVGGTEAALTPFTIAQMQALKIYSKEKTLYPSRAFDLSKKKNSMVIGEGAAMACLETGERPNAIAVIEGVGYATEPLKHNISISTDADCFQKSMKMALGSCKSNAVDAIVMHAPGTIKGDLSEYNAIKKVFGDKHPALTTNKWKLGHTFGASGMLSVELAILMMQHQQFVPVPFVKYSSTPNKIERILVNAVGFGGNAVSVLLRLPL